MNGLATALDTAIQRHVDATAFMLMRTFGVRKSGIRLGTAAIFSLLIMCDSLLPGSYGVSAIDKVAGLVIGAISLFRAGTYFRVDVAAERAQLTMSPIDAFLNANGSFLKKAMSAAFVMNVYAFFSPEEFVILQHYRIHRLILLISWLFVLIYLYLAATPPSLPPEKKRLTELVPIELTARDHR